MNSLLATLQWYSELGVDEAIVDTPWNRFASPEHVPPAHNNTTEQPPSENVDAPAPALQKPQVAAPLPPVTGTLQAELAAIETLDALRDRLERYEDCALKSTATHTVFGEGPPDADLMIIGEAPGEEEDRQGKPFVGPSGRLLDRMLAAIGLERAAVYITNTIYWRPPGNRTPTPSEVQACQPFLRQQIAIIRPKVLLLVGGAAAKTMLNRNEGIMRLRGRWLEYDGAPDAPPIPTLATFHPAYLLRSPAQKREAWRDLLTVLEHMHAANR